jgi:rod shape-determining protein MreC
MMMIDDNNSRVPIITSISKERGILVSNGDFLKVIYLRENHNIVLGEEILTSGDGQIYPNGLKVAKVVKVADNDVFATASFNSNNLEYIQVEIKD